ncbi:hypothetical protein [Methylobacterium sp. WL19]|uniref:hypothetical protein n=1 Tax=Methylobacterium sp. WL19 TaxID=2603896 RepID=UPI0011CB3C73|nr:hypothetical protein [Methylobacterium sp. WL19]TXN33897.1 hypothetical protein FV220_00145 [Methylobacterium sp. WL19]
MRYALAFVALSFPSSANALDCGKLLEVHAFLSRSQFQCGFNGYDQKMINIAKECSSEMSDAAMKRRFIAGGQKFADREKAEGHDALCASVLQSFPNVVSR